MMLKPSASHFLYAVGICGLLFALIRTYYLVWKLRKEREQGRVKRPSSPGQSRPEHED